jgi:hypothetical protein
VVCLLREDFICVKLDTPDAIAQWRVDKTPTVMFVKDYGEGAVILPIDGQRQRIAPQDTSDFLKLLDKALKS